MKLSFEAFDSGDYVFFICEEKNEDPVELVFNDEPLEKILYGEVANGPTPANFFLNALPHVREISRLYQDGQVLAAMEKAAELAAAGYPLSVGMCYELASIMKGIVPSCPKPVIEHGLSGLGTLLAKMWDTALKFGNNSLRDRVGSTLYRWYEHHQQFEDARSILTVLIEISKKEKMRISEAVYINNFGVGFILEGRWREAIPYFENAAAIFEENGDRLNYANARANYWICRIECRDIDVVAENKPEVENHAKILANASSWQKRKPLFLLAKIAELHGDIRHAIKLAEQAIEAGGQGITRYPEMDYEYLRQLKSK